MAVSQLSEPLYGVNNSGYAAQLGAQTSQNALAENQRQFDVRTGLYKDWMGQQKTAQTGLQGLLDTYNQAYNTAKQQNEAKYQGELGLLNQNTGQQRADTIAGFEQQKSNAMQGLARTGMANTTAAPTIQAGMQRQEQGSLNNLADQLAQQKVGVMQGYNDQGMDPSITATAMNNQTTMATRPFAF